MKKLALAILVSAFLFAGCSSKTDDKVKEETKEETTKTDTTEETTVFTVEELSKYNGQNGEKAYVAVDGLVYDVTEVDAWKNGKHQGFEAGTELTEEIANAPHMLKVLEDLTVIGTLEK